MHERISKAALLEQLKGSIDASEREALKNDSTELVISRYNRATLLRMLALDLVEAEQRIEIARADGLKSALQAYLNRYMADQPGGHKWIILSCLFLAFIAEEPMHPREIVGWRRADGGYVCPARDAGGDSLCRWCACRSK